MTDWRPSARPRALRRRARLLAALRTFFAERGVMEVSTPVITECGVTDPQLESLALAGTGGYLRTSPEYWHKRLLAAGFGDLYELGPVFRGGEHGRQHQREFTLLEWYRVGWSWRELAAEVVELIELCLERGNAGTSATWRSYNQCFLDILGVDVLTAEPAHLADLAADAPPECTRDMLLDYLFATRIQPTFRTGAITIVHDYPASQAALARLSESDHRVAERFEVFLGSIELANGYQELGDPHEQQRRFAADNRLRARLGRPAMPVDRALVAALANGLPDCAGVALGVDRLVMAATDSDHIDQVTAFVPPSGRQESG